MTIPALPSVAIPTAPSRSVSGAAVVTPAAEPTLWSMLSQAERAFFLAPTEHEAIGYGPRGNPAMAPPVLGQQLGVRG